MDKIGNFIDQFFIEEVGSKKIEIYNEFSLQHELGIFLRNNLENQKIQFERNVSCFFSDKKNFEKKEIDISIFSESVNNLLCSKDTTNRQYPDLNNLSCVMELKYPRNGQYPESMFSFCKDIAFLEQLVNCGFETGYFIAVADDPLFYEGGKSTKCIYRFFRDEEEIRGMIPKPTGLKNGKSIPIIGKYTAKWNPIKDKDGETLKNLKGHEYKYCVIKIVKTTKSSNDSCDKDKLEQ